MDFEKLDVWKRSAALSADLYIVLRDLKDWGFKDQITRAGLSVPSNIAEGMSRDSVKEKVRFLGIAQGSCSELRSQIYIGLKIGYVPNENGRAWLNEVREIGRMLAGLMHTLKKDLPSAQ